MVAAEKLDRLQSALNKAPDGPQVRPKTAATAAGKTPRTEGHLLSLARSLAHPHAGAPVSYLTALRPARRPQIAFTVDTPYLPLNYSGNPGVNDESYRGANW